MYKRQRITRVSDSRAFGRPGDRRLRHAYAKNQVWNADGSLLMLDYDYPADLLDGETYERVGRVHQPSYAVWMHTQPRLMIGTAGNRLVQHDAVADERVAVLHRFRAYREISLGNGEGNISNDDRYAALLGDRRGDGTDVLVYDLVEDRVVGSRTYAKSTIGDGSATFNNVTMSQRGARVIVEFNDRGLGPRQGIQSYDLRLRDRVALSRWGGTHYDACIDSAGRESAVVSTGRGLESVDLLTGKRTVLVDADRFSWSIHMSCRNTERPGWVYVSEFYSRSAKGFANENQIIAIRLDGSGRVEQYAHEHRSRGPAYEREPHAVPSPDGSRVLWASDWDRKRGPVYAYVADSR